MDELDKKSFIGQKNRWFCNQCRNETNHTCKFEHFPFGKLSHYFEPDVVEPDGTQLIGIDHFYRVWICDGCEDALLEVAHGGCRIISPSGETKFSEPALEMEVHPRRTEESVPVRHFANLPEIVANAYYETVVAHHNYLHLLCALGLRNLVEAICVEQSITGRNLEEKIAGLKKIMPAGTAAKLHILRVIGNEAAHEFKEAEREDLRAGIEICEDVLNFLYELDYRAARLARSRQDRERQNP